MLILYSSYLEIVTLGCQYHLVGPHLAAVPGHEDHIIEEAVLVLIELPEVLHQLHGVLWYYQVVGGEPDPPRPGPGYGLSLDSGTRQNKSLNH